MALIHALDSEKADNIIDAAAAIKLAMFDLESSLTNDGDRYDDSKLINLSQLINESRFRVNKLMTANR